MLSFFFTGLLRIHDDTILQVAHMLWFASLIIRIEGALFGAIGLGAFYALTLPFEQRHPALLLVALATAFAGVIDGHTAGFWRFGSHIDDSATPASALGASTALAIGMPVVSICNWIGFFGSRAAAGGLHSR